MAVADKWALLYIVPLSSLECKDAIFGKNIKADGVYAFLIDDDKVLGFSPFLLPSRDWSHTRFLSSTIFLSLVSTKPLSDLMSFSLMLLS